MLDNISKKLVIVLSLVSISGAKGVCQDSITHQPDSQFTGDHSASESLTIAAGDTLSVHVYDDSDLDQSHLHVTDAGEITLLLAGSIRVAGLTPGEAGNVIAKAYMDRNILVAAHVAVAFESITSSQVTVLGCINGVTAQSNGLTLTLYSPRPLLTVLAMAGGFNEKASRSVTIERHRAPGGRITVTVPMNPLSDLEEDPLVYPGDIIVVPRAGIVYVLGDVAQPRGIVMNEDGKLSLLQVMSQSAGPLPNASLKHMVLFRRSNGEYQRIAVDFSQILKGTSPDIALAPEDAIYVPYSFGRNLLVNGAAIAAALTSATATGLIYSH